jgi:hypothetical protein
METIHLGTPLPEWLTNTTRDIFNVLLNRYEQDTIAEISNPTILEDVIVYQSQRMIEDELWN